MVTFGDIEIREYIMTVGDNPSVSIGPPVALSWDYEEVGRQPLEEFEKQRAGKRKTKEHHLKLNYYQRKAILEAAGIDDTSQKSAERQVFWDQQSRSFSRYLCYPHVFVGGVRAQTGRWRNKRLLHKLQSEATQQQGRN